MIKARRPSDGKSEGPNSYAAKHRVLTDIAKVNHGVEPARFKYVFRAKRQTANSTMPCPTAGGGVNRWLLSEARSCAIRGLSPIEAEDRLWSGSSECGRRVKNSEVQRALIKAYSTDLPVSGDQRPEIKQNLELTASVIRNGCCVADLWELSPARLDDVCCTEQVITALFPANALLCVGVRKQAMFTAPLIELQPKLNRFRYIVPNAMAKPAGVTQDGKPSARTLNNVGPRMYFVADFDSGDADDHAAIILHLAKYAPLAMVLHTGNRGLHSWFRVAGAPEEAIERFMDYAVSLGADKQLRVLCQYCRMPDATRETGERQSVIYFNPEAAK